MTSQPVIIGNAALFNGNCLDLIPALDGFDHLITDPPYEQRLHDSKAKAGNRALRKDGGRN